MTAIARWIGTKHPRRGGSNALVVATLRDLGMPWEEVDAILETDDPRLVRRFLQLHAERLEERLADQRTLLLGIEPILAPDPSNRRLSATASRDLASRQGQRGAG